MNSGDPEWGDVWELFKKDPRVNCSIKTVHCIYNPITTSLFESTIQEMEIEANDPFYSERWKQEKDVPLRERVIKGWESDIAPYSPFSITWADQSKRWYKYQSLFLGSLKDIFTCSL